MSRIPPVLLFFLCSLCFAQNETSNWFFGDKAGIKFSTPTVNVLDNSAMTTPAGCSSISDIDGNLLFYTNGETVWNKNHLTMENGTGLAGEITNTQSVLIIPKPKDENIYYIITTRKTTSSELLVTPGIYYSEVEFSTTSPLGKITTKNRLIRNSASEKITATHHANGINFWLITFGKKNSLLNSPINTFMTFEIDENGINLIPVVSEQKELTVPEGNMKISPDGKTIAIAEYDFFIYFYNFNSENANISFDKKIGTALGIPIFGSHYGVEFSQDSKTLYYSCDSPSESYVFQFLYRDSVANNPRTELLKSSKFNFHSLQLAKNGHIYISKSIKNVGAVEYSNYIDQITFPEKIGQESKPITNSLHLNNGKTLKGLPNFITSYFRNRIITENQCVFDTFDFSLDSYAPIKNVAWDFGDGNYSNEVNPQHTYNTPGEYNVTAIININNKNVQLYKKVTVFPLPDLIPDQKIIQCDNDTDGISLFNLNNIANQISKDSTYTFKFYRSMANAENDMNEISAPENFYNESNPQTIYTKATTVNGCSNIESFSIETVLKPSLTISPIVVCGELDNTGVFNLENKKNEIINDFSLSPLEKISFFASLSDAQKTINILPPEYLSTSTTIWVKTESEQTCSSISPIDLIVNSPQINLEDNYTICFSPSDHSSITLTGDSSNDSFEWRDENNNIINTNNTFTLTRAGKFSLTTYKTINGIQCSNFKAFTVNYPPPPDILDVQVNVINETENNITITIIGDSSYEYSLDDDTYVGNGTSHTFTNVKPGISTVYIRDINNCESPTKTSVSIIGYPKFLTPNADGFNDYWTIYGANSNFFKEIDVRIFNRFGKTLYILNNGNAHIGWDGTYNGIHLPTNDYWFHAKLKDLDNNIIDKKGHFTLKRN